ncbi:hypothetical protein GCM10010909_16750 [Acidocella aquatica]|uniref:ER-bound oxygenase mpaB/mpaB'/Rubber oxygenase catalytic domain-containing protein n=1 Tax=Acidocella aquatica TaxID=1922313 RepID=A0ABQ6A4A6_9PROT|nr:oxygenase MpaB family protein [Acidocella aquatica]GLR66994.1 hypothetical protein GCM10010909_16750 [Acidocella aquatica]
MKQAQRLWLGTSNPYIRLRKIESLDLETEYRQITQLFYGDFQSAMFMKFVHGFLFTYSAPRVATILSNTGELLDKRITKRIVDTTLLASATMLHGFKEPEGRDAARRVNAMHSRYDIHPDDFVAVGAEEAIGSLDLAHRFGWRKVTDKEEEAVRMYYSHQARAFGSPLPLPPSVPEMRAFFSHFLDTELLYQPENERLANALLDWFAARVPSPLRSVFRTLLIADLDPRVARACGLRQPPKLAKRAMEILLRRMARKDPVPDGTASNLDEMVRSVYPNGWKYDDLGTHGAPKQGQTPGGDLAANI